MFPHIVYFLTMKERKTWIVYMHWLQQSYKLHSGSDIIAILKIKILHPYDNI